MTCFEIRQHDPTLQNVCKMKWRDVIHAEYHLLSNFGTYKKKMRCGNVIYPYNTKERQPLPKCAHNRIEDFIKDQFREKSLKWQEVMINKLGYSDSIQKDFIKQTLDPLKRRESFSKWDGRNRKPHAISWFSVCLFDGTQNVFMGCVFGKLWMMMTA